MATEGEWGEDEEASMGDGREGSSAIEYAVGSGSVQAGSDWAKGVTARLLRGSTAGVNGWESLLYLTPRVVGRN